MTRRERPEDVIADVSYRQLVQDCARELDVVRESFRDRFSAALKTQFKSFQSDSVEDMRDLVFTVNRDLHTLGIAIRCPKTGHPADLKMDRGENALPRFRLALVDEPNHRSTRTIPNIAESDLELMVFNPGLPFNRWTKARGRSR